MRLKSHQQQQQQQQQQSSNQRLKTHVTIIIIIIISVVAEFCLLATTTVAAAVSSPHPAAIQIGDPKQRILRQAADDDKARDDCDCDTSDGVLYHKPHFTKGRSVIVELFEWKFVDVAEECRTFLGPKGYAGVQLSPVLEHTLIKTGKLKHPWWQRYETVSYRFASRSGDESDFWSMSRICNNNGVRIYLDVLLNHMAAPLHLLLNATTEKEDFNVNTLLETNVNIFNLSYPNVPYTYEQFHRPCAVGNSQSAHEIRNCQLNGHPDLDLGLPSVQKHIVGMLNKFIDMGVAGFHVYGAKYVWPNDLKVIHEQLKDLNKDFNFAKNSRPFMYHDIVDIGLDSISKTEHATYGGVTEYLYAAELSTILRGKAPLTSLINWGPAMGFLSHQDAVIFVDSPETQRGLPNELGKNRVITYRDRQKYTMANALMMVHPYGAIKRIMSSYYYKEKNLNQGPPTEKDDEDSIRSPELNEQQQCTVASGWVCEHRWPMMVNLVALANYFSVPEHKEESVIHFQTNGPNHIAFCRGHKAFVAMNNDAEKDFIKDVFTCLEPGVYCDVISGGLKEGAKDCHGHRLEVDKTGYAKLNLLVADDSDMKVETEEDGDRNVVANLGVLVVYVGSMIGSKVDQVWEVPVDLGEQEQELSVNLTVVENPGADKVNLLSEEQEDSDAGVKAEGQISETNGKDSKDGGDDTAHDGDIENPDDPEVPDDAENNDGANSKGEDIVEDEGPGNSDETNLLSSGENNEVVSAGEEKVEKDEEAADGLVKDKKVNDDISENEESLDLLDQDQENTDDVAVAKGEDPGNEETINTSASQNEVTDEKQEIEEDVSDPSKEEELSGAQDTILDENQELTKGEEQGEDENPEDPNEEGGKDSNVDADANANADGVDELAENIEEKPMEESKEASVSDQNSNIPNETRDPDQGSNIPDEGENAAAPINDEEESNVAEVADLKEVENGEENTQKIDEALEAQDPNPDSDIPEVGANTADLINDEEESEAAQVVDLDIDPEAPNASQEKGVKADIPNEEVPLPDTENGVTVSSLDEDEIGNKDLNETEAEEGSEETASEANDEATPKSEEGEDSGNANQEPNVDGKNNYTEGTNLQIEKPLPEAIEESNAGKVTGDGEVDKTLLQKYNTTTYEIVNNITERLPFSDNNSKAAVKADEVISAGIFPAPRTQHSNGQQMLKSHSFLLWLIVVKMLLFDFNLKKIQFHLMLKPTSMA